MYLSAASQRELGNRLTAERAKDVTPKEDPEAGRDHAT